MPSIDPEISGEIASRLAADCQTMSDTVALNVNVFLRLEMFLKNFTTG